MCKLARKCCPHCDAWWRVETALLVRLSETSRQSKYSPPENRNYTRKIFKGCTIYLVNPCDGKSCVYDFLTPKTFRHSWQSVQQFEAASRACLQGGSLYGDHVVCRRKPRSRSALATTDTDESAIAALAVMGDRSPWPVTAYSSPTPADCQGYCSRTRRPGSA